MSPSGRRRFAGKADETSNDCVSTLSFFCNSCIIRIEIYDNAFQLWGRCILDKQISLDSVAEQQEMKIIEITGSRAQRTRMLQMGFTPGARVRIVRRAPMNDPVEIKIRGTSVLLRRDECQNIKVAEAE